MLKINQNNRKSSETNKQQQIGRYLQANHKVNIPRKDQSGRLSVFEAVAEKPQGRRHA